LALGIPGATLIVVALICLVVFMTKTINRSGADPNLLLPFWGFVLFMLTYGLVGMWNISSTGYTLLGMGLGVVLRLSLQPRGEAESGSATPTWPRQTFDFPPHDSLVVEG
jgi:O-antigen ligase